MKVLIAPDSFKGTLSAREAAEAIAEGVRSALPSSEIICLPLSDGGEGALDCLKSALGGEMIEREVTGPLGETVVALYLYINESRTAIIEMASASGLLLVPPEKRDPKNTDTYGTGELILAALSQGAKRIILTLGGSATVDGGVGMASALGYKFYAANGEVLSPGGGNLVDLERIDASEVYPPIFDTHFTVISDVNNLLLGERGAAAVFAPQKGATPEDVRLLEAGLQKMSEIILRDLGVVVDNLPGGGAAGGLGAGAMAFLNARLLMGAPFIMNAVHFEEHLSEADWVITGEGRVDFSTLEGKVPFAVAQASAPLGKNLLVIGGQVAENFNSSLMKHVISLSKYDPENATRSAHEVLKKTTSFFFRSL